MRHPLPFPDKRRKNAVVDLPFPSVGTRQEFVDFVMGLHDQVVADPDSVENSTVPRFLDALAGYIDGSGALAAAAAEGRMGWNDLALVVYAGLNYE